MPALDLARAAVFLDFDGTLSTADVGVHLLERLAPPEWHVAEAAYDAGEIGSRACLVDEWALLPREPARLRAVAAEVALDPAGPGLVRGLRAAGAEVTVLSDGFGFYVHELLAEPLAGLDVRIVTNAVDWETFGLEFPNADGTCTCAACGTCKPAAIRDARHRGRTTVMVGDGTSDRMAARAADVVFATGPLADWCGTSGVPCTPFATLADVHAALLP
jgi:2,3-diketo-5-methylthio-1-phosphopentane phosphatase